LRGTGSFSEPSIGNSLPRKTHGLIVFVSISVAAI